MALKKGEVMHLLSLVESHPIVYTKTTNATSNKLKDAAWLDITNRFNALIKSHPRKPEQLRLKWENLKKNARKRHSNVISKSGFGIPDYIHPDEVLDKVASLLGPSSEGLCKPSENGDISQNETNDLSTVAVIPTPSDEEEFNGPIIDCLEVGVGGEGYASNIERNSNTMKETGTDQRKKAYAHRTGNGKSVNLMATEVESRIHRNNAIAEYYNAKKKKIDIEIALNTEILRLQKKKLELEMLELKNKNGSAINKDNLLIEKKKVELGILEGQRRKYLTAASLLRTSSDGF